MSVQGLNCLSSAGGCLPLPFPQPHCPQTCPERARLGHGAAGSCTPDARSFSLSARRAGTGIATTAKRSFWFVFFFPEDDCAAFFPQHSPLHMSPLLLLLFLDLKFTLVVKIFFFPETLFNSEHCIMLKENGFF